MKLRELSGKYSNFDNKTEESDRDQTPRGPVASTQMGERNFSTVGAQAHWSYFFYERL